MEGNAPEVAAKQPSDLLLKAGAKEESGVPAAISTSAPAIKTNSVMPPATGPQWRWCSQEC